MATGRLSQSPDGVTVRPAFRRHIAFSRLQLPFELSNFFNHASFQGVDTTTRFDAAGRQVSGTFAQYPSTLDARPTVPGAKFYFQPFSLDDQTSGPA